MSLEEQVANAFSRRADDVQPRPGARATFERHVERAYRRRTVASSILGIAILATLGLATASLPRAIQEPSFISTEGVSTYRFRVTYTVTGEGETETGTQTGAADLRHGLTRTVLEDPMEKSRQEIIWSKNAVYLRSDPPFHGKSWIKSRNEPFVQGLASALPGWEDPSSVLESLSSHATKIQDEGPEEIDGETLNHFRAELDARRFFAPMFESMKKMMQAFMESTPRGPAGSGFDPDEYSRSIDHFLSGMTEPITFDVWLGQDDLTRRLEMRYSMLNPTGGTNQIEVRTQFFDYGTPVNIELPPDSAVLAVDSLFDYYLGKDGGTSGTLSPSG